MKGARFLAVIAMLAVLGIASAVYVLIHQRAPVPFRDTYPVTIELAAADGVAPGLGQPVLVAGVQVGSITGERVADGNAAVTVTINRKELPRVHTDATASLEPITPLKDMQLNLDPGSESAPVLRRGTPIGVERTRVPVPLSDLLSSLDGDTRGFLGSLMASLDVGTVGTGASLKAALRTLGPTTEQVGDVSRALARRRTALARLVHNLALITRAGSVDRHLAELVDTSDRTLAAIAVQERPLQRSLARLPDTLDDTRVTLDRVATFSRELEPTLDSLLPAVQRLPKTLDGVGAFARTGTQVLRDDLIPFVDAARPVTRRFAPAVRSLSSASVPLTKSLQVFNYLVNELAYNPPGEDEGYLHWILWFGHNFNSVFSQGDAHGGFGRSSVAVNCNNLSGTPVLDQYLTVVLGIGDLCRSDPAPANGGRG